MNKKLLIEQMEMLSINYIDFNGYNEVDQYNNDDTIILNLFDCLYNEFIKPINNILETLGIDWVYFHSIQYLDNKLYVIFKDENIKEYHLLLESEMEYNNYDFIKSLINNDEFKNFSLYDMIEYLNNNYNYELSQYESFKMYTFNDEVEYYTPTELVNKLSKDFNINDDLFIFKDEKIISMSEKEYQQYLKDNESEIKKMFYETVGKN
mgnify:CR=1 FL=1